MKADNNDKFDELLYGALARKHPEFDFDKWKKEHESEIKTFTKRARRADISKAAGLWRIIMKSRIIRYAAAAVVMITAIASIIVMDKSVPAAFGIEQIVKACNAIRFVHVKQFNAGQEEPLEYWIQSDEHGNVLRARYYLPEHVSPEDGSKLVVWTPEKAELYFKRKNSYLIFQSKKIEQMMKNIIAGAQPQLVMAKLVDNEKAGKAVIETSTPADKQKPATITASSAEAGKKQIFYVDQATNLITSIESYHLEGNKEVLDSTTEFFDYNVPIDAKMFTLKDEVPKGVTVVDQLNQLIGIPQGTMTDEQAAVETVRQFFEALKDKDYKKAGLIFSGVSEEKAKEYFGSFNITAIRSVGPATYFPLCGIHSYSVPCEVEITGADGKVTSRIFGGVKTRCGDDEMHPDRWIIHGGI